jgi:hypothetical protein
MEQIMASCKRCNAKVPVLEMVLDIDYKKVVCRQCVKDKGKKYILSESGVDEVKTQIEENNP